MSIADLQHDLDRYQGMDLEYVCKMMHEIPPFRVIDREAFIVRRCRDKVVLNIGSVSGALHDQIKAVARSAIGLDKEDGADVRQDLDDVTQKTIMGVPAAEVIVAGEVMEHLANPGYFLQRLRAESVNAELIITVPNALGSASAAWAMRTPAVENVNKDHVAWYSWRTLKTLLERYGWEMAEFYWYKGRPVVAEGMVCVAR